MKRPVATSRISASSSQLSQSRRTTSTSSAASSNSSATQPLRVRVVEPRRAQRRDRRGGRSAPPRPRAPETCTPQAGPAAADVVERGDRRGEVERLGVGGDRRSGPARCAGSAARPGRRSAPRRAGRGPGRCARPGRRASDCRSSASSMVTKSSRPRSACWTRPTQYAGVNRRPGSASGSRQAAGCQPAPSSATARCSGGRGGLSEGGGRVEDGLGDQVAADAPLGEDLRVVAVGDQLVDRVGQRLGDRGALRGDEPDRGGADLAEELGARRCARRRTSGSASGRSRGRPCRWPGRGRSARSR